MSSFIRIVNWDRLQHYKDRNPPWIKLHRDLLTSETWVSSTNDDRVLAIAIMMLAAATGNRVPANPRYIQRIAYLEKEPDLSALVSLKFIEVIEESADASKPLASARPETETEKETETLEADASNGAAAPKTPVDLKAAVFDSGVSLLTSTGTPERNARSMIGRWLKHNQEGDVLAALADATARHIVDPIPWLRHRLEKLNGRPDPIVDAHRRAVEECAAADQAAHPGARHPLPALRTGSA